MGTVVWASIALDIQPTLVSVFNSIYKPGFSFRIACIRCQIFVHQLPLIDTLVGLCPYLLFNLARRCHRTCVLHLSFPSLFLLVVCLFVSRVLLIYTLCGYRLLRILELAFLALCRA